MTIAEILEQAKALSREERDELVARLQAMQAALHSEQSKTGAEIVAMLEAMEEPIELVDSEIEDPVEWVKAQRRKRQDKLKPYRDGEA